MKPLTFYVITDLHYFKNSLGAYGEEYERKMDFEQKCFAETQAINEAVFDWLAKAQDADTVLIAGDLTYWGEKESNLAVSRLLHDFKEKTGKRVCLVTAGHDFDRAAYSYDNAGRHPIEGTSFSELYDLYKEFGYSDAIAFNREHLSYIAQLSEDVRLLVICNDVDGHRNTPYDDAFFAWIEAQAKQAQADGQMMIAMEHYPVLAGQPILALIGDARETQAQRLIDTLADNGVHLIFTGHMHNQSINVVETAQGNKFYDVCTGAIVAAPAFMRRVTIKDEKTVQIESIPVPEFDWDKHGLSGEAYLKKQFDRMLLTFFDAMRSDPRRFMDKVSLKPTPALEKLIPFLGKRLSKMKMGTLAHLLCTRADPQVKDMLFTEFAVDMVRSIFEGNQPYVEGTPGGDTLLRIFGRLRPLIKTVKGAQGETLDFYETMKHTVGNYGIDDYNAELILF
ncbi:MAG: metallophosphoesterase [Clostridia bacterium]|nr:metallophosphoesterase [Clostridia bacterium]